MDFRMQPMVMQEGGMIPTPPAGLQQLKCHKAQNPAMMEGQINQTMGKTQKW